MMNKIACRRMGCCGYKLKYTPACGPLAKCYRCQFDAEYALGCLDLIVAELRKCGVNVGKQEIELRIMLESQKAGK